jgi:hypothetical protein
MIRKYFTIILLKNESHILHKEVSLIESFEKKLKNVAIHHDNLMIKCLGDAQGNILVDYVGRR